MTSGVARANLGEISRARSSEGAIRPHREEGDLYHADQAANAHLREMPEFSAAAPFAVWQTAAIYTIAIVTPAGLALSLRSGLGVVALILALPFALIVLIRVAALACLMLPARRSAATVAGTEKALPTYSIFVPVYRETEIAPALIQALGAIDYPTDKLEVLLITEDDDQATRDALVAAGLAAHMRVLTVPRGSPQTKPRALNYALRFASGELITIFDAEDVPDPMQLRRAAEMFASNGEDLACVQARLSIYNSEETFLTRHFALEYAVLFETILPALDRMRLPILLGGTSNHFRRTALTSVGAWDAYNVTEDADLGVRLARFGFRVAMLDSDTWEEAPATPRVWLGQRTRWLKGWMQTFLVHTRSPRALLRHLGIWQTFWLQILLGGMILSALVHPWIYVLTAVEMFRGNAAFGSAEGIWLICWFNFTAGHLAGIALALIAAWRSEGRLPLVSALLVPIYWLAISAAAYRALWDFYRRPYYWEKTSHAARPVTDPFRAS